VCCIAVRSHRSRLGWLAVCVLLAMRPSSLCVAQALPATPTAPAAATSPAASTAPRSVAIQRYLPELLRLRQASDWTGLARLAQQALDAVSAGSGPDSVDVARAASWLAIALQALNRPAEAEALLKHALAIDEAAFGKQHPFTGIDLARLAEVLNTEGLYEEAEPLLRRALDIQQTAAYLNLYAQVLQRLGRYAEAEQFYQRALQINEATLGSQDTDTLGTRNNLASLLRAQGRYPAAETLMRDVLRATEARFGPDDFHTAIALNNLAGLLDQQRRYGEAATLYQRALPIDQNSVGPEDPLTATVTNNLALSLLHQGRNADADGLWRRALAIQERVLGPRHPDVRHGRENQAENDEALGHYDDAVANYRSACGAVVALAGARDQRVDTAQAAQIESARCSMRYSLALWSWAAQGGGTAPQDRPDALKLEAFTAAQLAVQSAAGDAMSRSAAFAAAVSATVGPQARAYETALLDRDTLDLQFAAAMAAFGPDAIEHRQLLGKARDQALARIDGLEADLKARAPRYWDFRSPAPVSIATLQAGSGADSALLHEDEALITWLVAPGNDRGLVFAVSREQAAWARVAVSGNELQGRVIRLRQQIDPAGYRLRGITVTPNAVAPAPAAGGFDRRAAYELYQALLGDSSIQAVIQGKPVLLIVPSGPLTSLPPGLLVSAAPAGDAASDADPEALRATAWLLRSKAVALLPAVASLRTLRQILPLSKAVTPDPLLAFADPDFHRLAGESTARADPDAARGGNATLRAGVPLRDIMDHLPDLPGTRIEGEALQRALGAPRSALLLGRDASKAQLMARNADGRLSKVRVLEFATHGLVVGDVAGLAEPALVLAAAGRPEDELLSASEAATLRLNADWVLLSACNTASPDAPEARGFSGLSRAFFYAGARSLLISHWEVLDSVAPVLIPAMLQAERADPHLGHAQALRRASLAILDDRRIADGAQPYAWAAFTLVGEAQR
jgi:CHAT domain-containing protein/tetratricopeptide (TPR) repeat protein